MTPPLPAIAEADARGETAELFADIRSVVGVRVVNLVWRHLATFDGALPMTWAAVRPLYTEGIVDAETTRFRGSMVVPRLTPLAGEEPPGLDAVLASYDHSNPMNLFALGALLAALRGETSTAGDPLRGARIPAPDLDLPRLLSEAEVAPQTWTCVLRLNRFGDQPQPLILASMYRHLAHWPHFLGRVEAALGPVQNDGSLPRAIDTNLAAAKSRARVIASAIVMPATASALRPAIEPAIAMFVDHAIGKMTTIGRALREARATV